MRKTGGRARRQGRRTGKRRRGQRAVAAAGAVQNSASTPRDAVTVRLGGVGRRGGVSAWVRNGKPSGPVLLSRRSGAEFVEIDGRVGRNGGARVRILGLLGAINSGDRHEGNHVIVIPSLELNLHGRPLSSGVSFPLDQTGSSLLVRIPRTRDNRVGVGPDQQSRQSNGSEE